MFFFSENESCRFYVKASSGQFWLCSFSAATPTDWVMSVAVHSFNILKSKLVGAR